jgi:hypothetical protein
MAGCAYADLERMVTQDGVESTLAGLARHGVFLPVDEAKGRRPVIRGSTTFDVAPASLANPPGRLAPGLREQRELRPGDARGGGHPLLS